MVDLLGTMYIFIVLLLINIMLYRWSNIKLHEICINNMQTSAYSLYTNCW